MKKQLHIFLVLLAIGGLILSACSAPSSGNSTNVLAIAPEYWYADAYPNSIIVGQKFRGTTVNEGPGDWDCWINCFTTTKDATLVKIQNGKISFGRDVAIERPRMGPFVAANPEEILLATKAQQQIIGGDPSAVYLEGRIVVSPDLGPSLEDYLALYGTEERLVLSTDELVKLQVELYKNKVAVLDNKIYNANINLRTGKIAVGDLDFIIIAQSVDDLGNPIYPAEYEFLKNSETFEAHLRSIYQEQVEAWRATGALPKEPFDKPGSIAPTAGVPQNTSGYKVGDTFDGATILEIEGNWLKIQKGNFSEEIDEIWKLADRTRFRRVHISSDGQTYRTAFRLALQDIGMDPNTVTEYVFRGMNATETPNMGVPFKEAFKSGRIPLNELSIYIEKLVQRYIGLSKNFGLQNWDPGTYNAVITEANEVFVVDWGHASLKGQPGFLDEVNYSNTVIEYLYEDMADLLDELDDALPAPTVVAPPPAQPAAPAVPNEPTVPVRILSNVSNKVKVYQLELTQAERSILASNTDDAARLLVSKGIPMPNVSIWGKGLRIIGIGVEYAGYAYMAYELSMEMMEFAGKTENRELRASYGIPTENYTDRAIADYNQLVKDGFGSSSLMWVYKDSIDAAWGSSLNNRCHRIVLDNQLVFFPHDGDTFTPITMCANPDSLIITNLLTNETSWWKSTNGSWKLMAGSQCHEYPATSLDGEGESAISMFETCAFEDGTITHQSIFWRE